MCKGVLYCQIGAGVRVVLLCQMGVCGGARALISVFFLSDWCRWAARPIADFCLVFDKYGLCARGC